jgi:hypothetical protein
VSNTTTEEPGRWPPIAGIDLKTYALVTAVLLTRGITGPDRAAAIRALGIRANDWQAARTGWSARIANDDQLRDAYAEHYRRARQRSSQDFGDESRP